MKSRTCPECGAENFYQTMARSGSNYGPRLLPQLGHWFWRPYPQFHVVVCGDCGFTRFFAETSARKKLPQADQWSRI